MTQLTLFHEPAERVAAELPSCLFDVAGVGLLARLAAFDAWKAEHGVFAAIGRSHAWWPGIASAAPTATDRCSAIVLWADLRCDHFREACCCVGDLLHRGACRCCAWEGPIRDSENAAAEDAHDHAWPGWRDLPIVPQVPDEGKARERWLTQVTALYPPVWLETGGPIRTRRKPPGTRHVPERTPFGGWDLTGEAIA
ncbi:MAG: DUF6349 family protein [Frankiaceae bacterium]